jgi:hypothetical protein
VVEEQFQRLAFVTPQDVFGSPNVRLCRQRGYWQLFMLFSSEFERH